MSDKIRASLLSLTIIAVIVFSAVGTTTVYADGDPPPDPPPVAATGASDETGTDVTTPPTEDNAEATAAPTDESADDDDEDVAEATSTSDEESKGATSTPEAPPETNSESAEAAAEATTTPDAAAPEAGSDTAATPEPTEEPAPVSEESTPAADSNVLNEVPDNTKVAVLDANGEAQPLATQNAAEAIATSDPIWCPGIQAPTPGANGCTDSFTSFDGLLTFLAANPTYQGAGTIYVQQGAYTGSDPNNVVDFNSYNLSNINNADLTITGGWNTSNGTVDPAGTSSFTDTQILIGSGANPWGGSLTINNITMTFSNPNGTIPATPENGLTLHAQGDISLSKVNVTNAPSAGADLNAGGDVTVSESKFDRNKTAGALIKAGGNVTVVNSSFSNPANARRQITGLDIVSGASVTLVNVLANGNREVGTHIAAGGAVTIGSSFFSGTKAMNGTGASTTFLGYGLQVVTPNVITLNNVTANDNFLWGASLDAGGDIAILDSVFNANTTASPGFIDDTGLFIFGGANVALNNVTANDNRLFGAMIDAVGNVSINASTFNNNRGVITTGGTTTSHGHGLQITSLASISINNTNANNNMLFGGQLSAGGEVSIANSSFSNNSTGSSTDAVGKGLEIVSAGNVSLTNVVLDNNQTVGADITAGGDVFLDTVTATNNGTDGILIQQGLCTFLLGGTYTGNGQYGLNLGTSALNQGGSPVFSGNGAGDIFPASPALCSLVLGPGNGGNALGSSNLFASFRTGGGNSFSTSGTSLGNLTLTSFMANLNTAAGGRQFSIFTGKYAYIYTSAGLQIVAFESSSNEIAMAGVFRAY